MSREGGGVGSGLKSLAEPTSAGTGAFGGVFSTPYPWVWVSCLASLLVGVVLGLLSTVLAGSFGAGTASRAKTARPHQQV